MQHTPIATVLRATVALVALCSAMVLAQDKVQPSFAESQKANAQTLRQYSWKSRTEIKLKGESKNVKLEQVRYDANGALQKTPIGAPPAAAAPPQGGRGRSGQGKGYRKQEGGVWRVDAGARAAGGVLWPAPAGQAAGVQSDCDHRTGRGCAAGYGAHPGSQRTGAGRFDDHLDRPRIADDAARRDQTIYDKKPATLVADYQSVPNGPTYMAHAVLTYPEKNVELTVDNSDYVQGRP